MRLQCAPLRVDQFSRADRPCCQRPPCVGAMHGPAARRRGADGLVDARATQLRLQELGRQPSPRGVAEDRERALSRGRRGRCVGGSGQDAAEEVRHLRRRLALERCEGVRGLLHDERRESVGAGRRVAPSLPSFPAAHHTAGYLTNCGVFAPGSRNQRYAAKPPLSLSALLNTFILGIQFPSGMMAECCRHGCRLAHCTPVPVIFVCQDLNVYLYVPPRRPSITY